MSSEYEVLAPIYDRLGLSDYAVQMAPRMLNLARQNDWFGRQIIEFGAGTGAATRWFAQNNFTITAIDSEPAMLAELRAHLGDTLHVRIVEGDIRALNPQSLDIVDMVVAFDTMNTMSGLRDLEAVLKNAHSLISQGQYLIFDLRTLYGLTELGQTGDSLIHNESNLVVLRQSTYDFERQLCTLTYHIFKADDTGIWTRQTATTNYRGYPVQAVATLVKRNGFEIDQILDENLDDLNINLIDSPRVIFMVKKS